MPAQYDVAIIGFGPTGAVAAGLLGQAGHRVFVADKAREVYDKPRAFALDHEIMRIFQQLDLAGTIEPWTAPFTASEYYGVDGQLIKRLDMVPPPYPLGYTPNLVFRQPPVEAALRARVAQLPGVEVALGSEAVGLAQDTGGVTLTVNDGRKIQAKYCIAADGASSPTRERLGLALDDLQFDEPWLVVDVRVNQRGLARLPGVSIQYCDPERPCTYLVGVGDHRRWEISLLPHEDPQVVTSDEAVWRLLGRWITRDDATLWRQASYRFHALVARDWRQGRVFLAGDAAHQQPPFIGQGMCQGLRDAGNLAWKLDMVLNGRAGEGLLDTYGAERGRHVRALTTRLKKIGAIICERDPEAARRRDAALIAETGGIVRTTTRQDIIPPLEEGLLAGEGNPARGLLFPQPWIEHGEERVRLDTLTGSGWRLVLDADAAPSLDLPPAIVDRLKLRIARIGAKTGAWHEADGVLRSWFSRHNAWAAIVRPDHYVYATVNSEADLRRELESLGARL
jgi:3-(3-hydroxy-phenyl)propionate hydroxylase